MSVRTLTAAAALAVAVVVSAAGVRRHRRLQRVLARERAAHRLTDGCLHRDLEAFQARIGPVLARQRAARQVLGEADLVLDEALAVHRIDPHDPFDPNPKGGPA